MKEIFILMDHMIIGGVEKVLIDTVEILNGSNKYDITLFVLSGKIEKTFLNQIKKYVHVKLLNINLSNRKKKVLWEIPYIGGLFLIIILKKNLIYV